MNQQEPIATPSVLAATYVTKDRQLWHDRARGTEVSMTRMAKTHIDLALKYLPKHRRRVVVQAGGFCGPWPAYLSKHFERVYTFEPDPDNFNCLVHNASAFNVYPFRAALGDLPGWRQLQYWHLSGNNQLLGSPGPIPVMTIDQFEFDQLDMLVLDVEGYETAVYMGAHLTITKYAPVILAEQTGKISADGRGFNYKSAHEYLTGLGYTCVDKIDKDSVWMR